METKRKKLKSTLRTLAVGGLIVFFAGCSSAQKKKEQNAQYGPQAPSVVVSEIPAPQESYGPGEPPAPEVVFGPSVQEKKKINVVFTPGLARGFAAAGVLIALEQAGVEIESIYGVEIPGLISALYAFSQNQNEFEWRLQKLNTNDFVSKNLFSSFFKRTKISSEKLEAKIQQSLKGKKDFSSARVFLSLCENKEGGAFEQVKRVSKSESLYESSEGCDAQVWKSESNLASKPTVLVNFFGDIKAGLSKRDTDLENKYENLQKKWAKSFEGAALVITPKLNEYDLLDFDKKTDIVFKGKEATENEIEKIKELLK